MTPTPDALTLTELPVGTTLWPLRLAPRQLRPLTRVADPTPTGQPAAEMVDAALESVIGLDAPMGRALTPDDRVAVVLDEKLPRGRGTPGRRRSAPRRGGDRPRGGDRRPAARLDWVELDRRLARRIFGHPPRDARPRRPDENRLPRHDAQDQRPDLSESHARGGRVRRHAYRAALRPDVRRRRRGGRDLPGAWATPRRSRRPSASSARSRRGRSRGPPAPRPRKSRNCSAARCSCRSSPGSVTRRAKSSPRSPGAPPTGSNAWTTYWRGTLPAAADLVIATISGDPANVSFLDIAPRGGGRLARRRTRWPRRGGLRRRADFGRRRRNRPPGRRPRERPAGTQEPQTRRLACRRALAPRAARDQPVPGEPLPRRSGRGTLRHATGEAPPSCNAWPTPPKASR